MCDRNHIVGALVLGLVAAAGCDAGGGTGPSSQASPPPRPDTGGEGISAGATGAAEPDDTQPGGSTGRADPEATPPEPGVRAIVELVTLGDFPHELATAVAAGLREELDVEVVTAPEIPLPEAAYYPPRRRYRADRLLEFLNERLAGEPAATRVLGLTTVDISTTKPPHRDWGVFGLGELGGRSCVISTFRLRRSARDDDHLRFRVVTTAVHEVGHTLGLEHCTEPGCVMRDAEGSIRTVDTSTGHLGPECIEALDARSPRDVAPP